MEGLKNSRGLEYISLFSGAMGLDLGLERAGFVPICCVENNPNAANTIRMNRPGIAVVEHSVAELSGVELRKLSGLDPNATLRLLVGGPPCQAFSVFGNRLGLEDSRGQLVFEFVRLVEELQPEYFLMENVRGLLSMSIVPKKSSQKEQSEPNAELRKKGSLIKRIHSDFKRLGYDSRCFVVNSVNYGAPQIRERVLIIGNRLGKKIEFPSPTHSNREEDSLNPFKTLGDVIGPNSGFCESNPEVMDFSPRKLKYLGMVPEGGNWRSLPIEIQKESMGKSWYLKGGRSAYWRKLAYGFPSPTVVTMPNHAGTSMCHPTELRAISVGEAAAIQEFPNEWIFAGSTSEKFKQIGNAVPVRLGEVAGKAILDSIESTALDGDFTAPESDSLDVIHIRPHVRTRSFWKNGKAIAGEVGYYEDQVLEQLSLF